MALIVQKFGGTSVGDPTRIRSVAKRIAEAYSRGNQLVVVVSAMGHTTDELIALAHQVSKQPPHREMDMLLSAGERISMALLSMALSEFKVPAVSLTGSQSGIITDQSHRRARIRKILGDRLRAGLAEKKVVIVAGFQGVSETKEITTLGRGGSDTTAVALAAALGADLCEIFTDVDGVYSADPRMVKKAKLWKRIPNDLMVEMATLGAGVLHPRSVELAKKFAVPLWVRNSLNESEGTAVVAREDVRLAGGIEEFQITGVTSDTGKMLIKAQLARPSVLASLLDRAAESHLSVVAPFFSGTAIEFYSDRDGEGEWRKRLEELAREGFVKQYEVDMTTVPVSVIGDRISQDGAAVRDILNLLAGEGIYPACGVVSPLAFTVGVPGDRASQCVRILHEKLVEG